MPEVNKTESKGLEGLESNIKKWGKIYSRSEDFLWKLERLMLI